METPTGKSLNKIVVLTGPESTAKSSIALQLQQKLGGVYIEEYAREYVTQLGRDYTFDDIQEIAIWQKNKMAECRKSDRPALWFVDTYLIVTKIWFKWVYNNYPKWIDQELSKTVDCLYLLCSPDIEWKPDGVRENGGENRIRLFTEYKGELKKNKLNYRIVTGSGGDRVENALNFVEEYIAER